MIHLTTLIKQAETSLHVVLCSLISQVWETDEAYTRISEANTCFRISLLQRITCFSPLWTTYLPQLWNLPDSVGALTLPDVAILPHMSWCKTGLKSEIKHATRTSTLSRYSQFPQDNKSNFSLPPFPFVSDPLSFMVLSSMTRNHRVLGTIWVYFFFFFLLRTNYLCHSLSVSKESIWVRWWMTQSLNQSSHAQPLCSWVPRKKAVWISSILNQQLQLHRLRDHESQGRKGLPEVSVFFSPSVSYYSLLPCPSVQFPEHSLPVMQSSCEDRYCTCRWLSRALTASSLSFSPPEGIKTTASK